MTPTTEAGKRLAKALAYLRDPGSYEPGDRYVEDVRAILAIEAEAREQGRDEEAIDCDRHVQQAREQERARIRAAVDEEHWRYHAPLRGCVLPCPYVTVLAIIDRSEP